MGRNYSLFTLSFFSKRLSSALHLQNLRQGKQVLQCLLISLKQHLSFCGSQKIHRSLRLFLLGTPQRKQADGLSNLQTLGTKCPKANKGSRFKMALIELSENWKFSQLSVDQVINSTEQ